MLTIGRAVEVLRRTDPAVPHACLRFLGVVRGRLAIEQPGRLRERGSFPLISVRIEGVLEALAGAIAPSSR